MSKLQPIVRVLLTVLAAALTAVVAQSDGLPEWVQIVASAGLVILAGFGIIPPQVPVQTVALHPEGVADQHVR